MDELASDAPLAIEITAAIKAGDVDAVRALLAAHRGLATTRIVEAGPACAGKRSLLHVLADWPGHVPNGPAMAADLLAAGADVAARFEGAGNHTETPLHWAASNDDVALLDALLDGGARIDAPGAVIAGGTALDDATAFAQWQAARRLVARGARTTVWNEAALGLVDALAGRLASATPPSAAEITAGLWAACHGGQRATAELCLGHGADLDWIGYDGMTPLDTARRAQADAVVAWLLSLGARSAADG